MAKVFSLNNGLNEQLDTIFFYLMIKMRFRPMAKILCADNSAAVCQQKHFSQDEECLEVN